jgi:DNA-binding transcriptional LysR family regulator
MQLKQLKTLIAIADTGSFHAAAEVVCITQSAVSMQMKNLEEQLQIELFERSVRPPRLSNSAQLILEQARKIVELSDNLLETSPVAGQFSGFIRIGSIPGVSFMLPDTLCLLRDKYRDLQLRVFSNYTDELITQVLTGKLDAAVVTQPSELDAHLTSRQILVEPMVVLAPKDMTGTSDEVLLKTQPLISFNSKAEVSRRIEEALLQRRIKVDPIMEMDTLETFQMMIQRGLGIGILPVSSVRKHLRDELYIVPFGTPPLTRKITLIQRSDHRRVSLLDAFYSTMVNVAGEQRRDTVPYPILLQQ